MNNVSPRTTPTEQLTEELHDLIRRGLTFSPALSVFAEGVDDKGRRLITKAREQWVREGEVEIDDATIVSDGDDNGVYVLAWVWVADE